MKKALVILIVALFCLIAISCGMNKKDKSEPKLELPTISQEMAPEGEAESIESGLSAGPSVTEE